MSRSIMIMAGGTGGHPDADLVAGPLGLDDHVQQCAQSLERDRIAEEGGDVDQDGVEEEGELVRVNLQVVEVLAEARDVDDLHAPANAPTMRTVAPSQALTSRGASSGDTMSCRANWMVVVPSFFARK